MRLDISKFVRNQFRVVKNYGRPVTDLRVDCPFCLERTGTQDTKQHLHVSVVKEVCHCFRCGYKNNWVGLVMDVTGQSYAFALGHLYMTPRLRDFPRDSIEWKSEGGSYQKSVELPDESHPLWVIRSPLARRARRYLEKRGFDQGHMKRYGLAFSPHYETRFIIPVEDDYWQARGFFDWVEPKYINPQVESRHHIFNSLALDIYEEVVICEGALSAMAVGDNAIALVGREAPPEKLERMAQAEVGTYIVAFDSDAPRFAADLARALYSKGKKVLVWEYKQGDPADRGGFVEHEWSMRTEAILRWK